MRPDSRLATSALAVALLALVPSVSRADDDAATVALKKGYELKKAGKCAEAVVFLREAHEKRPSSKAVLNWAECEESAGRFLAARAHYEEGKRLADSEKQPELAQIADARLGAIASRIPKVVFAVPDGANVAVDGTARKADGEVELDPGEHRVDTKHEGYADGTTTFSVAPGERKAVRLALGQKVGPAAPQVADAPAPPRDTAPPSSGTGQRVAGAVTAGTGLALVGVGAALALGAKSSYDDTVATSCDAAGCDSRGVDAIAGARTRADVATALFVVGGVATGLGAVLFFTAKKAPVTAAIAGPSFVVRGTF